ncbi:helix-turn-helix transcriptional regulator [Pediococcus siamensis]|uniref:helix-turn-helix transcriptional regulator n=1 Tax=Pediococcus siamensis TaxID=381829 RepID=UPI0039A1B360
MKSNYRVAELLVRLMTGETLHQKEIQKKYGISLRTCQRDLADIREALTEYDAGDLVENQGTYRITRRSETLDYELVLATSNILLGVRALSVNESSDELDTALEFLRSGLSPTMQSKVRKQLKLPRGSYTPLSRPTPLLDRLREVSDSIANNQKLIFTYKASVQTGDKPLIHHAQPVVVFFEKYYFYVAMLSVEHHGYWLYRLDRIVKILEKVPGEKLDYATRFSLQDHRQQTYLLNTGSLTKIRFIYRNYVQTVLDYFPNARVVRKNKDGSLLIEAYVRIDGALLWLLSQGKELQVLSPPSLVQRMREELTAARNQYFKWVSVKLYWWRFLKSMFTSVNVLFLFTHKLN